MEVMYNSVLNFILFYLIYVIANIYCNEICGIETTLSRNKIVNGRDLEYPRKYPWYAALVFANDNRKLVCGGALIHERHVLTAAHCFKPYFESVSKGKLRLEDIYVAKLGVNNICISEEEVQVVSAIHVHIQEQYYDNTHFYDIALMVLETRVTNFVPICLPPARYESNNRSNLEGTIIGLGKEASNAWKTPCTVKEAVVPIQPDSVCKRMLQSNSHERDFQGAFCAGYPEGRIDTCQGDSGGPLQVYRESSKSWMILGITSFGYGCAQPKFYGVYTDVSHYLDWIHDKIEYDEKKNYEFNTTAPNTQGHQVSNSERGPSFQKKKNRNRAFNNWILNILQD